MMEQIARRKEDEESVLAGIKRKMERIKMRQERLMNRSALLESDDHYQGTSYIGLKYYIIIYYISDRYYYTLFTFYCFSLNSRMH